MKKNVRVKVSPYCLLIIPLIFIVGHSAFVFSFLLPVTVHEFGHIAAMRLRRVGIRSAELLPCGIIISPERTLLRLDEIIVAPAGALAGIVASAVAFTVYLFSDTDCALRFALSSLFYSAFNILPAEELDGGVFARAILGYFCRADRIDAITGVLTYASIAVLAVLSLCVLVITRVNITLLLFTVYTFASSAGITGSRRDL